MLSAVRLALLHPYEAQNNLTTPPAPSQLLEGEALLRLEARPTPWLFLDLLGCSAAAPPHHQNQNKYVYLFVEQGVRAWLACLSFSVATYESAAFAPGC
jgi:hypothetical protein